MEMRKEVEVLVDTVGLDDALFALADHADAMAPRLAALERGATVEAKPATGAVAPKVWPVGSKPPLAVGQVRRYSVSTYTIMDHTPADVQPWGIAWSNGRAVRFTADALLKDPLDEPWTEPAATPADPRIAELESRIRELEAKNHAQGVEWRAAEDRCREANERVRAAESRIAALTAERDAAVAKERADVVAGLRNAAIEARASQRWERANGIDCAIARILRGAHVGASEK